VKDAVVGTKESQNVAIARYHFEAALGLLTAARATEASPESPHLLLAG